MSIPPIITNTLWSWSYGNWITSTCTYEISLIATNLWVQIPLTVRWSAGTPVSSTNKTDCHDITVILLKVTLNNVTLILNPTHFRGTLWPWSYGPDVVIWISIRARCTTLCDIVCQWLATCQWFPQPKKNDSHDITKKWLKVALNSIKQTNKSSFSKSKNRSWMWKIALAKHSTHYGTLSSYSNHWFLVIDL